MPTFPQASSTPVLAVGLGAILIMLGASPALGKNATCSAQDFSAINHRFRTKLVSETGEAAIIHLKKWTLRVHCVSRNDRGVELSIPQRKAVFFEIGDAFARRRQSCMALQAVGMARLRTAPGLGGFWSKADMRRPEAQSVNQYLLSCIRSEKTPIGRSRSAIYREVVSGLAKPSRMQEDLRTADNVRIVSGARLAQALLDVLDVLLSLDFGKDPHDRRVSATLVALQNREAAITWNVLWEAMAGSRQRPVTACLSEIQRGRSLRERNLIAARALAGSRGTCGD